MLLSMRHPFRTLLSPVLAALLAACSPAAILNATISRDGLTVTRDVPYGAGPRQRLDLYRPTTSPGKLPVLVFLHGGNWRSGSKELYPFVAAPLARRGMLVAVPDGRLFPEVRYPDFLRDGARAVAWVAAHAAEHGGDPRRVVVMGHSAGAYNALMLAMDPRWLAEAGIDPGYLAGAVALAAPADFLPSDDPDVAAVFAGAAPPDQPADFADRPSPPLLLAAGSADTTVRPRNTTELAERVRAAGGSVEARIYPGIGHVGLVLGFAPWFRAGNPVLDDVARFVAALPPR